VDAASAIRYLATLVEAGFPLDRALGTAARAVTQPRLAAALRAVRERVLGGASLAAALADQPEVFPRLAVGMTQAGERGGHLAQALDRLAHQLEREAELKAQLWSALLYPLLVAAVGGVAVTILVLYVLPRFAGLLAESGTPLPSSTALVLAAGAFFGRWWAAILVIGAALAILATAYHGTPRGRLAVDRILLQLPLVGELRRLAVATRIGRTLSSLLANGLPILPALEAAAGALTDAAAASDVRRAHDEVRAGSRLASSLMRSPAFPYVFVEMVSLGEESGRLAEMLERAAATAQDELRRTLERLLRLVEPTMIIAFGAIVGFVALAMLQALYGVKP
jgi:type II secretory pathway component PulF